MIELLKSEGMKKKNILLIAVGTLAAAAATLFMVKKYGRNGTEKPPRKAPQLPIENPGSQDEFPKPPIESELG